jgi:phosphoribosyl 1,2-cyclic phosphodiesterase
MGITAISLQSGSNGNCIYVESGGVAVLLDAGISGLAAQTRLAECGIDIHSVQAVIISHDHADHVRCAGVLQRKFGLPIYITAKTLQQAVVNQKLGRLPDVRFFEAGQAMQFGPLTVHTLRTPHDAADGVAFVVEAAGKRLGIMTDLGHVFEGLHEAVASLDAVFIESNYDPKMLQEGPYPVRLQDRIRGPKGHLSNLEAAQLLHESAGDLKWACLAHLSEHNNQPQLALATHREILQERFPLYAASRHGVTEVFEV